MAPTKRPRVRIDLEAKLRPLGHLVTAAVLDRTGDRIALASHLPGRASPKTAKTSRQIHVWVARVRDGALLHELVMPVVFAETELPDFEQWPDDATDIALDFSPDGSLLAVAWDLETLQNSECSAVALFDLKSGARVMESLIPAPGDLCFSSDSRLLVVTVKSQSDGPTLWFNRDRSWEVERKGAATSGARAAFSADGQRLIVVDDTSFSRTIGVTFVRSGSRAIAGRSRPLARLSWEGPLAVAPDGRSALGACTVWLRGRQKRHARSGVWRWRPDAAPERLGPSAGMEALWIDPEGRSVLWSDGRGLVRQRIGHRRLAPIGLAPGSDGLRTWGNEIRITCDGQRIARLGGRLNGQVVFSRLRRRPAGAR